MGDWQFVALAILIAVYGGLILDRLPKPKRHKDFTFEPPDDYVTVRVETILEDEFNVTFNDEWEVGRAFALYGAVIPRDGKKTNSTPEFGKRTEVKIGTTTDWFQSSRIGGIRSYGRHCTCFVALPYQIAQHALDEVRRDPDQLVTLGFKRVTGKDGKTTFPIYSFELSKPLD